MYLTGLLGPSGQGGRAHDPALGRGERDLGQGLAHDLGSRTHLGAKCGNGALPAAARASARARSSGGRPRSAHARTASLLPLTTTGGRVEWRWLGRPDRCVTATRRRGLAATSTAGRSVKAEQSGHGRPRRPAPLLHRPARSLNSRAASERANAPAGRQRRKLSTHEWPARRRRTLVGQTQMAFADKDRSTAQSDRHSAGGILGEVRSIPSFPPSAAPSFLAAARHRIPRRSRGQRKGLANGTPADGLRSLARKNKGVGTILAPFAPNDPWAARSAALTPPSTVMSRRRASSLQGV